MDTGTSRSVLDLPVQVSDDGSVIRVLTDSEQRDHLHYDADGAGWKGTSIRRSNKLFSVAAVDAATDARHARPRETVLEVRYEVHPLFWKVLAGGAVWMGLLSLGVLYMTRENARLRAEV